MEGDEVQFLSERMRESMDTVRRACDDGEPWNEDRTEAYVSICRSLGDYIGAMRGAGREIALRYSEALVELADLKKPSGIPMVDRIRVREAEAHRLYGAVLSDEYRATKDISCHVRALTEEVIGLRKIPPSTLSEESADVFVDCLNSVAVSSYRLRNYRTAIGLFDVAVAVMDGGELHVSAQMRRKVLSCRSAAHFAYASDLSDGLVGSGQVGSVIDHAIRLEYESSLHDAEAAEECTRYTWAPRITRAEASFSLAALGNDVAGMKEAIEDLDKVAREIKGGGASARRHFMTSVGSLTTGNAELLGRAMHLMARCQLHLCREGETADGKIAGEAYRNARLALCCRAVTLGYEHVDVEKSVQLVSEVASFLGYEESNAPEGEDEAVSEVVSDAVDYYAASRGFATPDSVVNRIVRGDVVEPHEVLGIDRETFESFMNSYERVVDGD